MASLVDVAELATRLGLTLTGANEDRAQKLLDDASAEIRAASGQMLSAVTGDVITIAATAGAELLLPQLPASEPSAVTVAGVPVTGWTFDGDRRLVRPGGWLIGNGYGGWSRISVTYDHGYAAESIPEYIVALCCKIAGRAYLNPEQLRSSTMTTGNYSEGKTYGGDDATIAGGVYITPAETRSLRRALGLPRAASVPVGYP